MTKKIHPNVPPKSSSPLNSTEGKEEVMTVWRKSLMFNCEGFTVFDGRGELRFRVDNYSAGRRSEIVLMDACGNSVFTIRRKRLSIGENWLIHNGEEKVKPLFLVKKHVTVLPSKELAHVIPCRQQGIPHSYTIEGSYMQRTCTIYDSSRHTVAEIRRKEAASGVTLGGDVLRLIVQSGLDSGLVMAMVVALEQMYKQ